MSVTPRETADRRNDLLASIAGPLEAIELMGIPHQIVWPDTPSAARPAHLPVVAGRKGRLDWSVVPKATHHVWHDEGERRRLLEEAFSVHVSSSHDVAIFWGDRMDMPGICLEPGGLIALSDRLLDHGSPAWILACDGRSWLIECSLPDREICHAPSVPVER